MHPSGQGLLNYNAAHKHEKYDTAIARAYEGMYKFKPFVMNTMGGLHREAIELLRLISSEAALNRIDNHSSFMRSMLTAVHVALMQGNLYAIQRFADAAAGVDRLLN